jgi:hypothetical protein
MKLYYSTFIIIIIILIVVLITFCGSLANCFRYTSPYSLKRIHKSNLEQSVENQLVLQCALAKHVGAGNRPAIAKGFPVKLKKLYLQCVCFSFSLIRSAWFSL